MTKCNKWLVEFTLVASIAFSGCDAISGGSYCDDKDGQKIFTQLLKEYLLKNQDLQKFLGEKQKDLREYIDKVDFSYEMDKEHSIINEEQESAVCIVKNITIKFDKGDSILINGAFRDEAKTAMNFLGAFAGKYQLGNELSSRFIYFMGYEQNKKTKETRIEVLAPLFSQTNILISEFFKDIPKNIIDYYDGTGVLIDGKRKGACPNGVRQTRDKNGEIAFEGGCANGTKEGAWKYYENGFLAKEELYKNGLLDKATEYYPIVGKIKSSYTTDSNGNSKKIEYDEKGFINEIYPYSKNEKGDIVVNGKVFGDFSSRKYGLEKIEEGCHWAGGDCRGKYAEMSNDKIVLKRDYEYIKITGKTEQEIFENIDKTPPNYEVVVLGNLALRIWTERHYGLNELSGISVYKNDEKIGGLGLRDYYDYKRGYKSSGYCTTGQCQVMFKELIDKSFSKDKIYSALESAKPKE